MKNYKLYIACAAWVAAMILLPYEVQVLFIVGMFTE